MRTAPARSRSVARRTMRLAARLTIEAFVGSLAGIPIAYQHPLAPQLPPVGVNTSPAEGWAIVLGITGAALLMLGTGAYVLITARRHFRH